MKIKDLIIDRLEVTRGQFCKEVGITRPTLNNIISGRHQPRLITIKKICKYFKVDFHDYV